ncbi:MAG: Taurine-binding periplasmic protein [Gammaproteobacteria bacterium]|nr:Taurine-binding periplasmic protein [Gammaproteobacteria bacterium]
MMHHISPFRTLFVKFATAVLVTAFVSGTSVAAEKPGEITVAYFLQWPTANQVAQVERWYDETMGIEVNWRAFGNGNEMSAAMASGDVQIAYSQGLVPWVVAVSKGLPLKLVGVAVSYAENDQCVVHADTGITKENAKELEGKRVATPIGNVTHYKMLRVLDHLGVDANKVNVVPMNGNEAAAALSRGDVAMACAFGGPLVEMKRHGSVLMTAEEQEAIGIRVFDVISVRSEFAEEHPELLAEFLKVTDRANKAYIKNPEKYQPIIAEASGMEPDAAVDMLSKFSFPTTGEQLSDAWMSGTVQSFTQEVADFFVEQGEMDKALDSYDSLIDSTYLKKAKQM